MNDLSIAYKNSQFKYMRYSKTYQWRTVLIKNKDLKGRKFGRLTCVEKVGKDNQNRAKWLCRCSCGNRKVIISTSLTGGKTKSCGCFFREVHRNLKTTHSMSIDENGKTPRLYSIWRNMKQRCNNPNASKYEIYGGRGIKVCGEWNKFELFMQWSISNGYKDNLTLDRCDRDKGYCPDNCRWVTYSKQNLNKRDNRYITYHGETKTLHEWSQQIGINYSTLKARIVDYGWTVEKALNTPVRRKVSEYT